MNDTRWYWPSTAAELEDLQLALARVALERAANREAYDSDRLSPTASVAGCFVCFGRGQGGPGKPGELGWAAAALWSKHAGIRAVARVHGEAGDRYVAGLLAMREGPVLEHAMRALEQRPDLLFVNATARDHPRRAGLATHLGAILDIPSVGVTHRPLMARGDWPKDAVGARTPLWLDGEQVGFWLRTRVGARPLAIHPGWRTVPEACATAVLESCTNARTPEPLRAARRSAREQRASDHETGQ